MGFWDYHKIDRIHVELTNNCNAQCVACRRFVGGSPLLEPSFVHNEITVKKFKEYFPAEFLSRLRAITFVGGSGDPSVAKDTLEILKYLLENTQHDCPIIFSTNGGARTKEWWSEFGRLMSKRRPLAVVMFSIDGLEDTSHRYRRNVQWDRLMEHVKAYIAAGGTAMWDFIVFEHNEHQIEEAKLLSKQLGFSAFKIKAAFGVDDGVRTQPMYALNKQNELTDIIRAPIDKKWRYLKESNDSQPVKPVTYIDMQKYLNDKRKKESTDYRYSSFEQAVDDFYQSHFLEPNPTLDSAVVKCKSMTATGGREIYVSCNGILHPCCFVGTQLAFTSFEPNNLQLSHEINKAGADLLDLNKTSLKDAINSNILNRIYEESWSKPSLRDGKLAMCAEFCGQNSIFCTLLNVKT